MRTLNFQFIVDSRFDGSEEALMDKLNSMLDKLRKTFPKASEVWLDCGAPAKYGGVPSDPDVQFRSEILLQKFTRKMSWDDVMHKINQIKAPHYKFINMADQRNRNVR